MSMALTMCLTGPRERVNGKQLQLFDLIESRTHHRLLIMDSFAGLDGLAKSQRPKRMADQKVAQAQAKNVTWSGLDILGNASSQNSSSSSLGSSLQPNQAPRAPSAPQMQQVDIRKQVNSSSEAPKPSGSLLDDFDEFVSAPAAPAAPSAPAAKHTRPPANDPLSIFDSKPSKSGEEAQAKASFSFYREEEASKPMPARQSSKFEDNTPPRPPRSRPNTYNDQKIAQMVDMGFEVQDAERALGAMEGSVRGAVSWLMADAQGLELPTPKRNVGRDGDFGEVASQIGASMFATATSLFNKGRKEISKAYKEWEGTSSGAANSDGQPAWMRNQEKYERRARRLEQDQRRETKQPQFRETGEHVSVAKPPSIDARRATSDDSMPSRPPRPARISRAQMFREKQAQRLKSSPSPSPSPAPAPSPSPAPAQPSNSEKSSSPAVASSYKEPEVDLLNLTETNATPTSVAGIQSELAVAAKAAGLNAFTRGDYDTAVNEFSAALSAVPSGHIGRVVLLSNRAAAFLNAGDMKAALDDANEGIASLPDKGQGINFEGKDMKDIWVKLVTRQGQAAENLERFSLALDAYKLLLDNGYATAKILEAKRRCQQALDPDIDKKATKPDKPKPRRRGWGTTGAEPTTAAGKAALEKVRREHRAEAQDDAERDRLREVVSTRVESWKAGKEENLRALLASLHEVLWANSGWLPVNMTDLVVPKKVRLSYMKAIAKTHPDKVPSTAPMEVKLISQSVFVVIQSAWEKFRTENGL